MEASKLLWLPKSIDNLSSLEFVKNYIFRPFVPGQIIITPLGNRMLRKFIDFFENIAEIYGLQKISFPYLQPLSYWKESGRINLYDKKCITQIMI